MPDIQMCNGHYIDPETGDDECCQVRSNCYRHTATPSIMQAWGPPGDDFWHVDGCDNYIPNKREPGK